MPSIITTICYITDHQENAINNDLSIVKAAGITRLRNNDVNLNVLLVAFYSNNQQNMVSFSTEDVLLITGKFRLIEETDDEGNMYPILKITLTDAVPLNIDLINLPKFPLLINMTAVALENAEINQTDIIIPIETKDYMDQDNVIQTFKSYHLTNAQHLTCITSTVKKGSVMFISGELILVDETFIIHLRSINFSEHQKLSVTVKNLSNLPWQIEAPTNKSDTVENVSQTIATRVKCDGRCKKAEPYRIDQKLPILPKML
ncbi:9323_t:CDS:2 [Gigaspora margarita]|uniref:9323_t:CDS:1 n=1 Tax=Gigaspora margarita TaxID=4874 RepID=A0ABN7W232_GIGMA|nr:9323_t:CDS:2 [Gigaspora margarita]